MIKEKKIIVGISGASGVIYGLRTLEILKKLNIETHLVISKAAILNVNIELDKKLHDIISLADHHYQTHDFAASISSGSFKTDGMIIAPCSSKSFSEIATGVCSSLLTRAADVCLKERRKLVLLVRETPLHVGHLESLTKIARMGGDILPPVPAFYNHPKSIDDLVNHTIGRALDLFDIDSKIVKRWPQK